VRLVRTTRPSPSRNVLQLRGELPAGVVDERVDAAEVRKDARHRALDRFLLRMSQTYERASPPASAISVRTASSFSGFRPISATGPERREFMCSATADAGAAAGDDGRPSVEKTGRKADA